MVDKARRQATRRSDADSMAARKTLNLGRHNSAHPHGLLCESGGSLRWCSSSTGGLSEVSQIRPLGTDRSPLSTHCGRNPRPSEWIINRLLFRAGPKDRIGLRRQSGAQLSFSAHFSHCSALQLHLVAQQLSQLRRRVTTPASVFNPQDLYYRGYLKKFLK